MLAASVMVSAPAPPMRVSTLLAERRVGVRRQRQLVAAAAAEIDRHRGGQRGTRVMVSAPAPPVMVSMFDTVAELAQLPSVRVSLPAPRSIEPALMAAPRVTVSAPEPPIRV